MDAKILQKARKMFATGDYADRKKAVNLLVKNGYSSEEAWETLKCYFQMDDSRLNPEVNFSMSEKQPISSKKFSKIIAKKS